MSEMIDDRSKPNDLSGLAQARKLQSFAIDCRFKQRRIKPNLSGAPLSVYLVMGMLTGLLGNRVLLMSRIKTLIPCSPLAIPWAVPGRQRNSIPTSCRYLVKRPDPRQGGLCSAHPSERRRGSVCH